MNEEAANQYMDYAHQLIREYGSTLLTTLVLLIVGLMVIKFIMKGVKRMLNSDKVDPILRPFFASLAGITLKVILFISVLSMLGIEMNSFIALLGAMGLAVGMALSGTLSNLAGGIVILVLKPYRPGDFITVGGNSGVVERVEMFNTVLTTPDKKVIIIPNSSVSTGDITNFSHSNVRRVDWSVGISYGEKVDHARQTILEILAGDERILTEPAAPFVGLSSLDDSAVTLTVRVWVETANYWDIFFEYQEKIYDTFNEKGIAFPFPQLDVHLVKED